MSIHDSLCEISSSGIRELFDLAQDIEDVVSFGIGEPDFDTPEFIKKAAKRALDEGHTHYTPNIGRDDLREEIVKKLKQENNVETDKENVMITIGANQAFILSLSSFVKDGDEVLIPSPGFVSYGPCVKFSGGTPVEYPLKGENNFRPKIEDLEELTTEDTRAIFLNTPSNPTGYIIRRKELEKIADYLIENDLIALVDEVYENIVYENRHTSLASLNGMSNHVITINSFSKTYAMTGWRLGYVVAPEDKIDPMVKLQMFTCACPPNFTQKAAADIMNTEKAEKAVEKMVEAYRKRRDLLCDRIKEIPEMRLKKPEGAFYAFPNIEKTGMNSKELSRRLIEDAKVVCVPGESFGKYGENHLRLSYATGRETINEGMNRLENFFKKV
ncbi:aromatic amino acid aminotransferase [candidate division MSBL1 archaeon SCGC-AAA259I09]|uniref:Aminotransferase n=5 Tax=candidate division MSBL1 TaxID=215777 RepID=A0A133UWA5_9EURY|nr:aromatic amino acid aminotransferase [candidate division MSBL1 archaeon SCGC-AAA259B11]KXA93033.1 aromatic amino acid aminotransferase [candidate division MSBL1 archaeon SCGC-AAA259E22]KXA95029.1 aromatic amino acid aminotransferase [candidate division MSBL1 archaeon SCGC-AAA259I07]KXA98420.1 aromatic amino acid aminotransferase [candidate division MSBL1 archaeon SCGC-AAA259I09]KXA98443.1 aromatic amino acid aminotransferase [candidate division MSBL1 archaeon SCGC-AAA259M10]